MISLLRVLRELWVNRFVIREDPARFLDDMMREMGRRKLRGAIICMALILTGIMVVAFTLVYVVTRFA